MIEKLDTKMECIELSIFGDKKAECLDFEAARKLNLKINELVDAVNKIQLANDVIFNRIDMLNNAICNIQNRITALDDPTYHEAEPEPADPYAEQRKWVGKACWFWDEKEEEKVFGILTTIDSDCGLSDMCPYWNDTTKNWFEHCEPVKEDIIYKKEQQ